MLPYDNGLSACRVRMRTSTLPRLLMVGGSCTGPPFYFFKIFYDLSIFCYLAVFCLKGAFILFSWYFPFCAVWKYLLLVELLGYSFFFQLILRGLSFVMILIFKTSLWIPSAFLTLTMVQTGKYYIIDQDCLTQLVCCNYTTCVSEWFVMSVTEILFFILSFLSKL